MEYDVIYRNVHGQYPKYSMAVKTVGSYRQDTIQQGICRSFCLSEAQHCKHFWWMSGDSSRVVLCQNLQESVNVVSK